MRRPILLSAVLAVGLLAHSQAAAQSVDDKAVQKTLKTLISSIRYSKDDMAAKQLAVESMTKGLLGPAWAQMAPADQQQATRDFATLMRRIAFARGREMFQYLDAVLYEKVAVTAEQAHCKSTVVVHRDLKKTEIPIEWVLTKEDGQWRVVDTITMGESTAAGIRQDQVEPLLKEGGPAAVLAALHKKAAEASKP